MKEELGLSQRFLCFAFVAMYRVNCCQVHQIKVFQSFMASLGFQKIPLMYLGEFFYSLQQDSCFAAIVGAVAATVGVHGTL